MEMEDVGVRGRKRLKWTLHKQHVRMLMDSSGSGQGLVPVSCKHCNEHSISVRRRVFVDRLGAFGFSGMAPQKDVSTTIPSPVQWLQGVLPQGVERPRRDPDRPSRCTSRSKMRDIYTPPPMVCMTLVHRH
jgi:hypothetical protein